MVDCVAKWDSTGATEIAFMRTGRLAENSETAKADSMNRFMTKVATLAVWLLAVSACSGLFAGEFTVTDDAGAQDTIDKLRPGDICRFTPGVYRRSIRVSLKGTSGKPVVIDGRGAIFDSRARITGVWKKHAENIYRICVDHDVRQLFIDDKLVTPARWPNMTFAQRWDNAKWRPASEGTTYGVMVDPRLAESGTDFTGCVAILNIGAWQTFRRVITKHEKGSGRFTYFADPKSRLFGADPHPVGMDHYCIYGFAALDQPNEWYFDRNSSTLYLCLTPTDAKRLLEGTLEPQSKTLSEAIVLEDCEHVTFKGFALNGSSLRVEDSSNCTLDGVHLKYPSTIANPFGPNLPHPALSSKTWNSRQWFGETSIDAPFTVQGHHNIVRNCTVRFSEGPALTVIGEHHLIENCLFKDVDWHGLDNGYGIDLLAAAPVTVRYVTLDHCGGSEGLRLANHGKSLVEYCHLHHCGLRQSDGAIIQTSMADSAGTAIRYNWIHDHNAFHWGGNGIRGDDGSRGLVIHHNVVWNCSEKGIITKGDGHSVHHNTCLLNSRRDILMPRTRLPGKTGELAEQNRTSAAYNNIGRVWGNWIWEKPAVPPYGKTEDNTVDGIAHLRDPDRRDFRLKDDSSLIDAGRRIYKIDQLINGAGPDIGAYESGDDYWTPGYRAPALRPHASDGPQQLGNGD